MEATGTEAESGAQATEEAPSTPPEEAKPGEESICSDLDEPKKVKTVSVKLTKKRKLGIIIALISVLALVLIWGFIPEKYYEVGEIAEDPESFVGDDIQLIGKVANGSLDMSNDSFAVSDGTHNLSVVSSISLPDTIREGKDVTLTGELKKKDGAVGEELENYVFEAKEVKVGCPSKYD